MLPRHSTDTTGKTMKLISTAPALAALLAMAPAWAQDSLSVKELLDRAQIKLQTEAVEDLIRKLKAGERASEKTPEPPRPPPATAKTKPHAAEKSTPLVTEPPPAPCCIDAHSNHGSRPRP